ncbi:MAG: hypothetical protein HY760_05030 [Nitrospirae bacterium]|nr:hypothetical protein [Nitrospirota bacterium]
MYIYKAAVVGAGTMGAEIAQVISYSGLPVVLMDVSEEAVQKGIQTARKIYQSRVDKGKMTSGDLEQKMALILPATAYDAFADVDLVIVRPLRHRTLHGHPPPGPGDRDPFLQPGPRDEAD